MSSSSDVETLRFFISSATASDNNNKRNTEENASCPFFLCDPSSIENTAASLFSSTSSAVVTNSGASDSTDAPVNNSNATSTSSSCQSPQPLAFDMTTAKGELNLTKTTALKTTVGWVTVHATEGFRSGVHEWQVHIENQGETNDVSGLMVGIVPRATFSRYDGFISQGGGWCLSRGGKYYGQWKRVDVNVSQQAIVFGTGDVVSLLLDFDTCRLAVRVNGDREVVGELTQSLPVGCVLVPAVSLHYRQQHVRFGQHRAYSRKQLFSPWRDRILNSTPACAFDLPPETVASLPFIHQLTLLEPFGSASSTTPNKLLLSFPGEREAALRIAIMKKVCEAARNVSARSASSSNAIDISANEEKNDFCSTSSSSSSSTISAIWNGQLARNKARNSGASQNNNNTFAIACGSVVISNTLSLLCKTLLQQPKNTPAYVFSVNQLASLCRSLSDSLFSSSSKTGDSDFFVLRPDNYHHSNENASSSFFLSNEMLDDVVKSLTQFLDSSIASSGGLIEKHSTENNKQSKPHLQSSNRQNEGSNDDDNDQLNKNRRNSTNAFLKRLNNNNIEASPNLTLQQDNTTGASSARAPASNTTNSIFSVQRTTNNASNNNITSPLSKSSAAVIPYQSHQKDEEHEDKNGVNDNIIASSPPPEITFEFSSAISSICELLLSLTLARGRVADTISIVRLLLNTNYLVHDSKLTFSNSGNNNNNNINIGKISGGGFFFHLSNILQRREQQLYNFAQKNFHHFEKKILRLSNGNFFSNLFQNNNSNSSSSLMNFVVNNSILSNNNNNNSLANIRVFSVASSSANFIFIHHSQGITKIDLAKVDSKNILTATATAATTNTTKKDSEKERERSSHLLLLHLTNFRAVSASTKSPENLIAANVKWSSCAISTQNKYFVLTTDQCVANNVAFIIFDFISLTVLMQVKDDSLSTNWNPFTQFLSLNNSNNNESSFDEQQQANGSSSKILTVQFNRLSSTLENNNNINNNSSADSSSSSQYQLISSFLENKSSFNPVSYQNELSLYSTYYHYIQQKRRIQQKREKENDSQGHHQNNIVDEDDNELASLSSPLNRQRNNNNEEEGDAENKKESPQQQGDDDEDSTASMMLIEELISSSSKKNLLVGNLTISTIDIDELVHTISTSGGNNSQEQQQRQQQNTKSGLISTISLDSTSQTSEDNETKISVFTGCGVRCNKNRTNTSNDNDTSSTRSTIHFSLLQKSLQRQQLLIKNNNIHSNQSSSSLNQHQSSQCTVEMWLKIPQKIFNVSSSLASPISLYQCGVLSSTDNIGEIFLELAANSNNDDVAAASIPLIRGGFRFETTSSAAKNVAAAATKASNIVHGTILSAALPTSLLSSGSHNFHSVASSSDDDDDEDENGREMMMDNRCREQDASSSSSSSSIWFHVALVCTGTSWILYLNGDLAASSNMNTSTEISRAANGELFPFHPRMQQTQQQQQNNNSKKYSSSPSSVFNNSTWTLSSPGHGSCCCELRVWVASRSQRDIVRDMRVSLLNYVISNHFNNGNSSTTLAEKTTSSSSASPNFVSFSSVHQQQKKQQQQVSSLASMLFEGLILYCPLNEESGNVVVDYSAYFSPNYLTSLSAIVGKNSNNNNNNSNNLMPSILFHGWLNSSSNKNSTKIPSNEYPISLMQSKNKNEQKTSLLNSNQQQIDSLWTLEKFVSSNFFSSSSSEIVCVTPNVVADSTKKSTSVASTTSATGKLTGTGANSADLGTCSIVTTYRKKKILSKGNDDESNNSHNNSGYFVFVNDLTESSTIVVPHSNVIFTAHHDQHQNENNVSASSSSSSSEKSTVVGMIPIQIPASTATAEQKNNKTSVPQVMEIGWKFVISSSIVIPERAKPLEKNTSFHFDALNYAGDASLLSSNFLTKDDTSDCENNNNCANLDVTGVSLNLLSLLSSSPISVIKHLSKFFLHYSSKNNNNGKHRNENDESVHLVPRSVFSVPVAYIPLKLDLRRETLEQILLLIREHFVISSAAAVASSPSANNIVTTTNARHQTPTNTNQITTTKPQAATPPPKQTISNANITTTATTTTPRRNNNNNVSLSSTNVTSPVGVGNSPSSGRGTRFHAALVASATPLQREKNNNEAQSSCWRNKHSSPCIVICSLRMLLYHLKKISEFGVDPSELNLTFCTNSHNSSASPSAMLGNKIFDILSDILNVASGDGDSISNFDYLRHLTEETLRAATPLLFPSQDSRKKLLQRTLDAEEKQQKQQLDQNNNNNSSSSELIILDRVSPTQQVLLHSMLDHFGDISQISSFSSSSSSLSSSSLEIMLMRLLKFFKNSLLDGIHTEEESEISSSSFQRATTISQTISAVSCLQLALISSISTSSSITKQEKSSSPSSKQQPQSEIIANDPTANNNNNNIIINSSNNENPFASNRNYLERGMLAPESLVSQTKNTINQEGDLEMNSNKSFETYFTVLKETVADIMTTCSKQKIGKNSQHFSSLLTKFLNGVVFPCIASISAKNDCVLSFVGNSSSSKSSLKTDLDYFMKTLPSKISDKNAASSPSKMSSSSSLNLLSASQLIQASITACSEEALRANAVLIVRGMLSSSSSESENENSAISSLPSCPSELSLCLSEFAASPLSSSSSSTKQQQQREIYLKAVQSDPTLWGTTATTTTTTNSSNSSALAAASDSAFKSLVAAACYLYYFDSSTTSPAASTSQTEKILSDSLREILVRTAATPPLLEIKQSLATRCGILPAENTSAAMQRVAREMKSLVSNFEFDRSIASATSSTKNQTFAATTNLKNTVTASTSSSSSCVVPPIPKLCQLLIRCINQSNNNKKFPGTPFTAWISATRRMEKEMSKQAQGLAALGDIVVQNNSSVRLVCLSLWCRISAMLENRVSLIFSSSSSQNSPSSILEEDQNHENNNVAAAASPHLNASIPRPSLETRLRKANAEKNLLDAAIMLCWGESVPTSPLTSPNRANNNNNNTVNSQSSEKFLLCEILSNMSKYSSVDKLVEREVVNRVVDLLSLKEYFASSSTTSNSTNSSSLLSSFSESSSKAKDRRQNKRERRLKRHKEITVFPESFDSALFSRDSLKEETFASAWIVLRRLARRCTDAMNNNNNQQQQNSNNTSGYALFASICASLEKEVDFALVESSCLHLDHGEAVAEHLEAIINLLCLVIQSLHPAPPQNSNNNPNDQRQLLLQLPLSRIVSKLVFRLLHRPCALSSLVVSGSALTVGELVLHLVRHSFSTNSVVALDLESTDKFYTSLFPNPTSNPSTIANASTAAAILNSAFLQQQHSLLRTVLEVAIGSCHVTSHEPLCGTSAAVARRVLTCFIVHAPASSTLASTLISSFKTIMQVATCRLSTEDSQTPRSDAIYLLWVALSAAFGPISDVPRIGDVMRRSKAPSSLVALPPSTSLAGPADRSASVSAIRSDLVVVADVSSVSASSISALLRSNSSTASSGGGLGALNAAGGANGGGGNISPALTGGSGGPGDMATVIALESILLNSSTSFEQQQNQTPIHIRTDALLSRGPRLAPPTVNITSPATQQNSNAPSSLLSSSAWHLGTTPSFVQTELTQVILDVACLLCRSPVVASSNTSSITTTGTTSAATRVVITGWTCAAVATSIRALSILLSFPQVVSSQLLLSSTSSSSWYDNKIKLRCLFDTLCIKRLPDGTPLWAMEEQFAVLLTSLVFSPAFRTSLLLDNAASAISSVSSVSPRSAIAIIMGNANNEVNANNNNNINAVGSTSPRKTTGTSSNIANSNSNVTSPVVTTSLARDDPNYRFNTEMLSSLSKSLPPDSTIFARSNAVVSSSVSGCSVYSAAQGPSGMNHLGHSNSNHHHHSIFGDHHHHNNSSVPSFPGTHHLVFRSSEASIQLSSGGGNASSPTSSQNFISMLPNSSLTAEVVLCLSDATRIAIGSAVAHPAGRSTAPMFAATPFELLTIRETENDNLLLQVVVIAASRKLIVKRCLNPFLQNDKRKVVTDKEKNDLSTSATKNKNKINADDDDDDDGNDDCVNHQVRNEIHICNNDNDDDDDDSTTITLSINLDQRELGRWMRLAVVYDSNVDALLVYGDGLLLGTASVCGKIMMLQQRQQQQQKINNGRSENNNASHDNNGKQHHSYLSNNNFSNNNPFGFSSNLMMLMASNTAAGTMNPLSGANSGGSAIGARQHLNSPLHQLHFQYHHHQLQQQHEQLQLLQQQQLQQEEEDDDEGKEEDRDHENNSRINNARRAITSSSSSILSARPSLLAMKPVPLRVTIGKEISAQQENRNNNNNNNQDDVSTIENDFFVSLGGLRLWSNSISGHKLKFSADDPLSENPLAVFRFSEGSGDTTASECISHHTTTTAAALSSGKTGNHHNSVLDYCDGDDDNIFDELEQIENAVAAAVASAKPTGKVSSPFKKKSSSPSKANSPTSANEKNAIPNSLLLQQQQLVCQLRGPIFWMPTDLKPISQDGDLRSPEEIWTILTSTTSSSSAAPSSSQPPIVTTVNSGGIGLISPDAEITSDGAGSCTIRREWFGRALASDTASLTTSLINVAATLSGHYARSVFISLFGTLSSPIFPVVLQHEFSNMMNNNNNINNSKKISSSSSASSKSNAGGAVASANNNNNNIVANILGQNQNSNSNSTSSSPIPLLELIACLAPENTPRKLSQQFQLQQQQMKNVPFDYFTVPTNGELLQQIATTAMSILPLVLFHLTRYIGHKSTDGVTAKADDPLFTSTSYVIRRNPLQIVEDVTRKCTIATLMMLNPKTSNSGAKSSAGATPSTLSSLACATLFHTFVVDIVDACAPEFEARAIDISSTSATAGGNANNLLLGANSSSSPDSGWVIPILTSGQANSSFVLSLEGATHLDQLHIYQDRALRTQLAKYPDSQGSWPEVEYPCGTWIFVKPGSLSGATTANLANTTSMVAGIAKAIMKARSQRCLTALRMLDTILSLGMTFSSPSSSPLNFMQPLLNNLLTAPVLLSLVSLCHVEGGSHRALFSRAVVGLLRLWARHPTVNPHDRIPLGILFEKLNAFNFAAICNSRSKQQSTQHPEATSANNTAANNSLSADMSVASLFPGAMAPRLVQHVVEILITATQTEESWFGSGAARRRSKEKVNSSSASASSTSSSLMIIESAQQRWKHSIRQYLLNMNIIHKNIDDDDDDGLTDAMKLLQRFFLISDNTQNLSLDEKKDLKLKIISKLFGPRITPSGASANTQKNPATVTTTATATVNTNVNTTSNASATSPQQQSPTTTTRERISLLNSLAASAGNPSSSSIAGLFGTTTSTSSNSATLQNNINVIPTSLHQINSFFQNTSNLVDLEPIPILLSTTTASSGSNNNSINNSSCIRRYRRGLITCSAERGVACLRSTVGYSANGGQYYFEVRIPQSFANVSIAVVLSTFKISPNFTGNGSSNPSSPLDSSTSNMNGIPFGQNCDASIFASNNSAPPSSTNNSSNNNQGQSWCFDGSKLCRWHNGVRSDFAYRAKWKSRDVIGVLLDLDAGTLSCTHNGKSCGAAFDNLKACAASAVSALRRQNVSNNNNNNNNEDPKVYFHAAVSFAQGGCEINFGGAPFVFGPGNPPGTSAAAITGGYNANELVAYGSPLPMTGFYLPFDPVALKRGVQLQQYAPQMLSNYLFVQLGKDVASMIGTNNSSKNKNSNSDSPIFDWLLKISSSAAPKSNSNKNINNNSNILFHEGRSGDEEVPLIVLEGRAKFDSELQTTISPSTGVARIQSQVCTIAGHVRVSRKGRWYYETHVHGEGLVLVGWAAQGFSPDAGRSRSIGDDSLSWGVDGCRMLARYNRSQRSLGRHPWREGDVVGTLLDCEAGTISFYVNGVPLRDVTDPPILSASSASDAASAILFARVPTASGVALFPVVTVEPDTVVNLSFNRDELVYLPHDAMPLGCGEVFSSAIDSRFTCYYSRNEEGKEDDDDGEDSNGNNNEEEIKNQTDSFNTLKNDPSLIRRLSDKFGSHIDPDFSRPINWNRVCLDVANETSQPLQVVFHAALFLIRIARLASFAHRFVPFDVDCLQHAMPSAGTGSLQQSLQTLLNYNFILSSGQSSLTLGSFLRRTNGAGEPQASSNKLSLSRRRAANLPSLSKFTDSILGQVFSLLQDRSPSMFVTGKRLWTVSFVGEGADDAGGPYRESIGSIRSEVHFSNNSNNHNQQQQQDNDSENVTSSHDPNHLQQLQQPLLFIPSQNQEMNLGEIRDRFVFDCAGFRRSRDTLLPLAYFFGQLIGGCLRSGELLPLSLPSIIWKYLCASSQQQQEFSSSNNNSSNHNFFEEDMSQIDSGIVSTMQFLTDAIPSSSLSSSSTTTVPEMEITDIYDGPFVSVDSSGIEVPLFPGGEKVPVASWSCMPIFLHLWRRFRLVDEANEALLALARGFHSVIPPSMIRGVMRWSHLERAICGRSDFSVADMEAAARYEGLSKTDSRVVWFWQALRSWTPQDRSAFARFISGRERLATVPKLKLLPAVAPEGCENEDELLPHASTCFIWLSLPNYSNFEILAEKLLYAVRNCVDIDADFRVRDGEEGEGGDQGPRLIRARPSDDAEFEDYSHLL